MINSKLKTLQIVWFALISGQMVFFAVAYFTEIETDLGGLPLAEIALLFGGVLLALSQVIYKVLLKKAFTTNTTNEKLTQYFSANIVKGAMIEAGNITCIFAFLLTRNIWLAPFILGTVIWLILQVPTKDKFRKELNLTDSEISQ